MYFFLGDRLSNGQTLFNQGNLEFFAEFSFPSCIYILNNYMSLKVLNDTLFPYAKLQVLCFWN